MSAAEERPLSQSPDLAPGHPEQVRRTRRIMIVVVAILIVTVTHWVVPSQSQWLHAVHITLRKGFFIPIVLSALWLGRKETFVAVAAITLGFLPHIIVQWRGELMENMNQLGELATAWGLALLATWLFEKERAALQRAASIHEGAMIALVKALDAREHGTQQHSLRVRAFSKRLCDELGLDEDVREVIVLAALLHDVGKIGVSDSILLKPGPLTDCEREQMNRHPALGGSILRSVPYTAREAEIVHAHHEKFDGTGYPLGLRAKGIPLGARIFAVADVVDALTSERPYRDAISYGEAIDYVAQESGKHFDPEVVAAALRVPVSEWEKIARGIQNGDPSGGQGLSDEMAPARMGIGDDT